MRLVAVSLIGVGYLDWLVPLTAAQEGRQQEVSASHFGKDKGVPNGPFGSLGGSKETSPSGLTMISELVQFSVATSHTKPPPHKVERFDRRLPEG